MKVNTRVRYAIRLMADIARNGRGDPVSLGDVAERQGLSKLFLYQLAVPLRNHVLLKSVWGNRGGYVLARPADDITLLDIVEAVDGPIGVIDCLLNRDVCDRVDFCECISVWRDINTAITRILAGYTLAELIEHGEPRERDALVCIDQLTLQGV